MTEEHYCPVCYYKLQEKKVGLVCKNHHCPALWKMGRGAVFHNPLNTLRTKEEAEKSRKKIKGIVVFGFVRGKD